MNWDTIGLSKDNYRLSIEETEEGYSLHYEPFASRDGRNIDITHEEASNLIRFLRQAEQARIDKYVVEV